MLDDLKVIAQRDSKDALGVAAQIADQLREHFNFTWAPKRPIASVVYAGMGGSALAAALSEVWPGYGVPFQIVRGYDLPKHASKDTLVIVASYSGNTEEELSILAQAEKRGCQIVLIDSGGQLGSDKSHPSLTLPAGLQPRMTTGYMLRGLVTILVAADLAPQSALVELETAADFIQESIQPWQAASPTKQNYAKQLAEQVMGKTAVVYAGPLLAPAAYKWKINFNETSKNLAWMNQLPEFNHNEFQGWASHPVDKVFAVLSLRTKLDNEHIQKRFDISERLLSGLRPHSVDIWAEGGSILEQLLWSVALGDHVAIYLAVLNGVDPTPVELIERMKKELA